MDMRIELYDMDAKTWIGSEGLLPRELLLALHKDDTVVTSDGNYNVLFKTVYATGGVPWTRIWLRKAS